MDNGWRPAVVIGLLTGLVTSVIGTFVYTSLTSPGGRTLYWWLGGALATICLSVIAFVFRGKWFLLRRSGVLAYYPLGQNQCRSAIEAEIGSSQSLTVVGARGMDLIGEDSLAAGAMRKSKALKSLEVYLLKPGGKNSRLRSDYLEVEQQKYRAESESVDNYLGILKASSQIAVRKYDYTERPAMRMIVGDKRAFVSFYRTGVRGRHLPIWVMRRDSPLFIDISRRLDALRSQAELRDYPRAAREIEE